MPPRNLVNLNGAGKDYGSRTVLDGVTLGVAAGDRIGIVGRNGAGKSTLLGLIGGSVEPDRGTVTRANDLGVAAIAQGDELDSARTVRQELIGDRPDHVWQSDATFRGVLDGLLGGVGVSRFPQGLDTPIGPLSGGERRRIALAKLLLDGPELLLLDEPTNHLDVEAVDWLARHLAARAGSLVVITHDRWFLDAVCTHTWEVTDATVHQYEGGYAAYVLARAERDRQAAAREDRRQQLMRKELAWLRRGPPARTTKPKFRIEAANELIADEPPARDSVELQRFASARLGNRVIDAVDVDVSFGERRLLRKLTWRLGPGDRFALVGINGSGKTTLLDVLAGERAPDAGVVERGQTVRLAHLTQDAEELPPERTVGRVLEDASATLLDRFGFGGDKRLTTVGELSGGERRRLQLARILMDEPNVLLLDEPTNDLDIDTLQSLEDVLDSWPGTMVVVSHDRYFVERACDDVYTLEDGVVRHLPRGIDQYLEERRPPEAPRAVRREKRVDTREARKEVARLERAMEKLDEREAALHEAMAAAATDHERLRELGDELDALRDEREAAESAWLEQSALLES